MTENGNGRENLGANRGEGDRRRLWKGLDLLESTLCGVKERTAKPEVF